MQIIKTALILATLVATYALGLVPAIGVAARVALEWQPALGAWSQLTYLSAVLAIASIVALAILHSFPGHPRTVGLLIAAPVVLQLAWSVWQTSSIVPVSASSMIRHSLDGLLLLAAPPLLATALVRLNPARPGGRPQRAA